MVNTIQVGTDQVILGGNGALVSSRSVPGSWHLVKGGQCDCKGFEFRGKCRHVAAVVDARAQRQVCTSPVFDLAARTLAGPRYTPTPASAFDRVYDDADFGLNPPAA
jgi:hypothetical protein